MEVVSDTIASSRKNKETIVVWVESAPMKLILKRKYFLKNLERGGIEPNINQS